MRAVRLPATDRQRIAAMGGRSRGQSLEAARRITETLRYAAAVTELRGGRPRITRVRACAGPLPGIYPARQADA